MDLTGLPDDTFDSPGMDLGGLPDTNAGVLRKQYRATQTAPDEAAQVLDLSKRTGLPPPVVQRNRQVAQKQAMEPDWADLETSAPLTVRELAGNAKLFELAHDDTENLRGIENALNYSEGKIGGPAFKRQPELKASTGPETSFSSVMSGQAAVIPNTFERIRQGVRLEFADLLGFEDMAADANHKRQQVDFRESLVTPEIENTLGRWVYGGAANIQRVVPSIAASIATRSPAVGLAAMGAQVQPETYGKYRARGGTPGEAALGSGLETGIEIGTEMLPMGFVVDKFGKAGAKEFIAGYLGRELPTELAAEIAQGAVDTAIANPDKTWGDYTNELPETIGQTVVSTLMMSGGLTAVNEAARRMAGPQAQAQAAEQDAQALQQLAQLAAASKLRQRDPQTFQDFVAATNEDGAVQDLYLDARTLQQSGVDLAALAQAAPAVAQQISEALATGGDVVIPVSEYAAKIAGTEFDSALLPYLRTSEDAISISEIPAAEEQARLFQETAAKVMEERAADTEWQQSAKAVEAEMFKQLQSAGRFTDDVNTAYSTLMRDFYVATASRLGITPQEMFARYPLQVRADSAGGANVMEQGNAEESIRTAFEAVPSVSLGTAYPITGEFNGRKMQFMARHDALKGRNPRAALHLVHLKRGRMISGGPEQWIAQEYKLDGKNNLKANGMPKPLSDEEAAQFNANFPQPNPLQRMMQSITQALGMQPEQPAAQPVESVGPALDMGQFFQADKPDLIVQHNLSADNLLHAVKMGGIPVPSLAITKKDHPLTGFGEITLLGSKDLVDPKGYASTKVFGADIYSPRYPSIDYQFTANMQKRAEAMLKEGSEATGSRIDWDEWERRGVEGAQRTVPLMWKFLKEQGIEPTIVRKEAKPLPEALLPFVDDPRDYFDLQKSPEFSEASYKAQEETYVAAGIEQEEARQRVDEMRENGKTRGVNFLAQGNARAVDDYRRAQRESGSVDARATGYKIEEQVREEGLQDKFNDYAREFFADINPNERIFQGYTNNGRRYVAHTLENVVKILKKELRGGEGVNYGVGSIRSSVTPQFKSIKQIREAKDRLMDKAEFEKVKDEIDKEFFALAGQLEPYHPASKEFGFGDTVSSAMYDAAKMGIPRALKENGFSDVPVEAQQDIAEFLGKLRDLPTEYFEAKILRDVDLTEFSGAVVPEGVNPKVIEALNARGVKDIRTYKKGDDVDRRAKIGEFESLFFQPNQTGNRGEIAFGRDITQTPSVITLFQHADLSTFLHEMGHFQLEVLANIASQPNAPAEIAQDMEAVLKWFGVADLDTWRAMSLEEKRPYHEQFARGFESYLFEGKAPSTELASLFARFRSWLVNVYKSIKALNVEINDELRGVFDRMVATDESIKQAEAARNYGGLFKSPEEMGATPEEWAEYQNTAAEATQSAVDDLQKRSLRDMRWLTNARGRILKEMQRDASAKRKAVEEEVRAEVEAMPIYTVQRFLRTGGMTAPDGDLIKVEKGYRLDNAALAEMYPESMLSRPALEKLQGMTRNDGLAPDLVAEMFGFTSGDQLVREIIAAEPKAQLIEGMADQRVLERYGDLADPDTLARATDEAIHNEARARFVATELKAITKATGPVRAMTKAAKDFAATLVARKKVRDIKPNKHAAAETRAAKAAEKAMRAGDTTLAATEKRNQLVQNFATRASYDALTEIEKAVKYLRKFDSEGTRKGLDAEYTDQIDALLERFDLRASVSNKDAAKRTSLLAWVESQREQGFEPDIPPELLSEAMRKPYRELTLEELRGLVDTVKQVEHLGRLKKKLLTSKDEREFAAIVSGIASSIEENAQGERELRTRNTTGAMLKDAGNRFLAMHRKMASVSREMDGFKDGGPMWEYLIRSMNTAGDRETSLRADATAKLYELVKPLLASGKMGGKGVYFDTIGMSLNREERIAIALNMGNAGNMQRLMDGEGWTMTRLQPVLDTITPEEADFVQAVWDFFESYRPEIAAKERRIYGKEPEWVEPVPLTLGGKQLKGGYYPIKYDPARSGRAEQHAEAEAAKAQMRGAYTSATTRRSFAKSRAQEVTGRPLMYSFAGIYQGTNEVIHDLTWHEWLIDANRLVRALDGPIRLHYGPETITIFKKAIEDIAAGDVPAQNVFEKGINHLRMGATVAGLGWNLTTSLLQPFGLTQSMVRVGPGWVGKGLTQWLKAPIETGNEVQAKSAFMRDRARTMQREINEIQNQVRDAKFDTVRGTFFLFIQKMQTMADMPTWLGAYEKAIAEGNAEERAVALADQAVIDAQGGGQIKDLAQIQRGGPLLKLWTNFYSFFNVAYNLGVEKTKQKITQPKMYPSLAMDYLLLFVVPSVMVSIMKAALEGETDDEDELTKRIIGDQISYLMGTMVGLREVSAATQKLAGVEQFKSSYGGPAGLRLFQEIDKLATQSAQGEADVAWMKAANNVAGNILHYPSGQINKTVEGAAALIEGKTENPAALFVGAPKN